MIVGIEPLRSRRFSEGGNDLELGMEDGAVRAGGAEAFLEAQGIAEPV
jgi:hypothetical protein